MNPALLLLLLGGAAAIAVASSSGSSAATSDGPIVLPDTGSGDAELVAKAQQMVKIYDIYSTKMFQLTMAELDELGKLNAEAKGIDFVPLTDYLGSYIKSGQPFDQQTVLDKYKQTFYLPPGTGPGPDLFSAWATSPDGVSKNAWVLPRRPTLVCQTSTATWDGSEGMCVKGYFLDFFGRQIGTYTSDGTLKGESDLSVISDGVIKQFEDAWGEIGGEVLSAVASVASNYPGIGTVVSVAITFLQQIGSGASYEDAALSAARNAIPSAYRGLYDIGVGLATRGEIDYQAALTVAMSFAISEGVITGDMLEKYNTIKAAYDDAKEAQVTLTSGANLLSGAVKIAA